jgi:ribosomal protein S17E
MKNRASVILPSTIKMSKKINNMWKGFLTHVISTLFNSILEL